MILIDGQKCEIESAKYQNLEEIFTTMVQEGYLDDRVVTDVLINSEPYSEIYPHQSEDIDLSEVQSIEVTTMATADMAIEITRELYKVVTLMVEGGKRVATLFRQADDAEALETYQDLLDVTRNFLGMIGLLRNEYSLKDHAAYVEAAEEMTNLFTEMTDVLENEDWILLADLLEYEFLPAAEKWKKVIAQLREDIRMAK
ncbi:hypothetical protein [Salidesulfovibrio onnuriiensis]|uniref:hypothetical protein n=1 Tax=Salidesulfovibrio onnuriiensis TaxID=2583823 RepID=UPI0011C99529|nr:hypothetical protein [Salidesulfovibrio onnuriiensis]